MSAVRKSIIAMAYRTPKIRGLLLAVLREATATPFFRTTKGRDRELWEAFASDGEGADFTDERSVEIPTRQDAEALLASLRSRHENRRPELLIQMLAHEILGR